MAHPMLDLMKANNVKEYEDLEAFIASTNKVIGYFVVKKVDGVLNPLLYYYDGTEFVEVNKRPQTWNSFF